MNLYNQWIYKYLQGLKCVPHTSHAVTTTQWCRGQKSLFLVFISRYNSEEIHSLRGSLCPTFANILVLQPQLSLDLFVRVPDGTGLLEAVHRLLHIVVPELPEDRDKVAPLRCAVQRMDGRAEGCVEGGKRRRRKKKDWGELFLLKQKHRTRIGKKEFGVSRKIQECVLFAQLLANFWYTLNLLEREVFLICPTLKTQSWRVPLALHGSQINSQAALEPTKGNPFYNYSTLQNKKSNREITVHCMHDVYVILCHIITLHS